MHWQHVWNIVLKNAQRRLSQSSPFVFVKNVEIVAPGRVVYAAPCSPAPISPTIRLTLMDVQVPRTLAHSAHIYFRLFNSPVLDCWCHTLDNRFALTLSMGAADQDVKSNFCSIGAGLEVSRKLRKKISLTSQVAFWQEKPGHLPLTDLTCVRATQWEA